MSGFHRDAPTGDIHQIHQWTYADSTAKAAATGFVSSDVGKVALQLDTSAYYILTDDSPITWQLLGDASASTLTTHTSATAAHGATGAVVGTTNTQTLTNKTLTAPVISSIVNTGTLTLPTSTDTLVGRATTDTLTNKTLTSPAISTPTGIVKGDVGLGNVDNTSDATKNAATVTLTNKTISGASNTITNVSLTTGVTGTLPLGNGGTGQTTANAALNALLPSQTSNSGKVLSTDGTNSSWATAGTGTVTSVTFTGDGVLHSTTPSTAVTTTGTLTPTLKTQTANTVMAGPSSGSAAAPTFRAMVTADLPTSALTNGGTSERVERVKVTNNGTAAIGSQSGSWVSSVTRNGVGDVTINIAAGIFSSAPVVTVTAVIGSTTGGATWLISDPTTSAIRVLTTQGGFTSGNAADQNFNLIAVGPK